MNNSGLKLLALCDSPTCETGFGRVAQNLLKRWRPHFDRVDIWAINYVGHPHPLQAHYRIFPASNIGTGGWNKPDRMQAFIDLIDRGDYTHVFLLQDTFMLSENGFPAALKRVCDARHVKSMLYYPVDAALEPDWTAIVAAVDVPVAYTDYGFEETHKVLPTFIGREEYRKAIAQKRLRPDTSLAGYLKTVTLNLPSISVLPHGVDTKVYHPLPDRAALRASMLKNFQPEDTILLNVNANQRRKDTPRSLQLLSALKSEGLAVKLIMHMSNPSVDGIDLEAVGRQLGLEYGKDWIHNGKTFKQNWAQCGEAEVNKLYNIADLVISTSLGEGWGLSITEALAAGCPVAVPNHTSCREIADRVNQHYEKPRITILPVEEYGVVNFNDNSRVRPRVDVEKAARTLIEADEAELFGRVPMPPAVEQWLSWDRLAGAFLKLMGIQPVPAVPLPDVSKAVLNEEPIMKSTPKPVA